MDSPLPFTLARQSMRIKPNSEGSRGACDHFSWGSQVAGEWSLTIAGKAVSSSAAHSTGYKPVPQGSVGVSAAHSTGCKPVPQGSAGVSPALWLGRQSGRDSRCRGCEKGFSHQRGILAPAVLAPAGGREARRLKGQARSNGRQSALSRTITRRYGLANPPAGPRCRPVPRVT